MKISERSLKNLPVIAKLERSEHDWNTLGEDKVGLVKDVLNPSEVKILGQLLTGKNSRPVLFNITSGTHYWQERLSYSLRIDYRDADDKRHLLKEAYSYDPALIRRERWLIPEDVPTDPIKETAKPKKPKKTQNDEEITDLFINGLARWENPFKYEIEGK